MTEYLYRPVPQGGCICAEWPDRRIIPLGSETADFLDDEFVRVRERNSWLHLVHCRGCGQPWYAAVDTVDDDLYFRRVSGREATAIAEAGEWPGDYDDFVNVWPDPGGTSSLPAKRPWSK